MLHSDIKKVIKSEMRLIYKLRDIKRLISLAFQRFFNGYDESMVWGFCNNNLFMMKAVLSELHSTGQSCPYNITEEEWSKILLNIIDKIDLLIWMNDEDFNQQLMQQATDEMFSLLSKWYWNLWD